MTRKRTTEVLSIACMLLVNVALAQPQSDADAVFQRGGAAYKSGDWVNAIATWERLLESLGTERGWRVLYNLGLAYQASGDITHAIERLDGFITRATPEEIAKLSEKKRAETHDAKSDAEARVRQLKSTHGAIRVVSPSSGEAILTRVDTRDPRPAGYTVWVTPGTHEIDIAPGSLHPRHTTVNVEAGATTDVDASPPPAPPIAAPSPVASPVPSPSPKPAETSSFPTGWIVAGTIATAVSVVLPVSLGIATGNKHDATLMLGPGNTNYPSAVNDYSALRTGYYVSLAVPAVLAAATLTVVTIGLLAKPRATVTVGGTGLWLSGRF